MKKSMLLCVVVFGQAVTLAAAEIVSHGASASAPPQRYTPVPGGFAIHNGKAQFTRPLYGWHGDDDYRHPHKTIPFTGDRPRVRASAFKGMSVQMTNGVLAFGDGTEDVDFRYVWGRAEYDLAGKGTVKMVRSASSDRLLVEATGDLPPKFDGVWTLDAQGESGGRRYYAFGRKDMHTAPAADPVRDFTAATDRVERIARTIEIKTPDPLIDSLLACQLVAADAVFEGPNISCGVTNWRTPYGGWRQAYIVLATRWSEGLKSHARLFFKAQHKDGRIPSFCTRDNVYNMNEVFVDSVLRYWRWSGDDDFMREVAYEGVKRHLDWMERNMKMPGTDIFENWLNAWNTDNKWCNGGGGTIASAYVAYAYRTMAAVARKLGRDADAQRFAARSDAVTRAISKLLWDECAGVWGEYRERFGLGRLMLNPDTSAVYTAIDSLPFDRARFRRAVGWIERNTPSLFTADGTVFLYSSNKLPQFYSSCGLYQQENFHWALACYQAGEPELGWRNLHGACEVSARSEHSGPGTVFYDLDHDLVAPYGADLSDSVGIFLRTVVEGVFGIVDGRRITPSFPAAWDRAEIKSPYVSYVWTRKDGVKITAKRADASVEVRPAAQATFAGAAMIPAHRNWGAAKGEGTDCTVPAGVQARPVDLAGVFNQEWRLLHARTYSPRIGNFRWSPGIPRTVMANGRSWWEWHEVCGNRRWARNYAVPAKLDWPQDGILRTKYGPEFKLGPEAGTNAVFTSFFDQFPKEVSVPLKGRAQKLALLTAVSTNPNVAWMEAAQVIVEYADGTAKTLSLVPPDNCDDWLGYSWGHWARSNSATDNTPYAVKGNPVQFAPRAHANVLAIDLDPKRELKSLRFVCRGTETLAGLLAATLY